MKKTKQHHFFLTIEREISNLYTTKRYQQRYFSICHHQWWSGDNQSINYLVLTLFIFIIIFVCWPRLIIWSEFTPSGQNRQKTVWEWFCSLGWVHQDGLTEL